MGNESYFDGGLLTFIGVIILGAIITSITFGICYPWALCLVYGWKINHTVIEGRRLKFNGTAINIKLEQWKVKNTSFEN